VHRIYLAQRFQHIIVVANSQLNLFLQAVDLILRSLQ
jgi:hypothetical protein